MKKGKDITGSSDEVPPGLESYEALREYSIVFGGGQTNMFIVNAEERGPQNNTAPIRDLPILDARKDASNEDRQRTRNNYNQFGRYPKSYSCRFGTCRSRDIRTKHTVS